MQCDKCGKRKATIKYEMLTRTETRWPKDVIVQDLCARCYQQERFKRAYPYVKFTNQKSKEKKP